MIALHLGGIAEWFSCIEIAKEFSKLNDWFIVFHGYSSVDYLLKFHEVIESDKISNVIISTDTCDDLNEIDDIIKSCDIGVAWYNNISVGFRTAGRSSGKIPAYLRFGLPVVSNNYPSFIDALEKPHVGICISSISNIKMALSVLLENYNYFCINALSEYDRNYNFFNYKMLLFNFLMEAKSNKEIVSQTFWDSSYETIEMNIPSKTDPVRIWIETFIPMSSLSCIEIGAYPGRYLTVFGELGYTLSGIDLCPQVEKDLPEWLSSLGFNIGSFKKDDFRFYDDTQVYDIVASFGFIEHFKDWENLLIKKKLLVNDGGYIIVSAPNFLGLIQRFLHFFLDKQNYRRHNIKSLNPKKWRSYFDVDQYTIIYCGYFGSFDFWVDDQDRNWIVKKTIDFILGVKRKFSWLPDNKLYSPYCGLIVKKKKDENPPHG